MNITHLQQRRLGTALRLLSMAPIPLAFSFTSAWAKAPQSNAESSPFFTLIYKNNRLSRSSAILCHFATSTLWRRSN